MPGILHSIHEFIVTSLRRVEGEIWVRGKEEERGCRRERGRREEEREGRREEGSEGKQNREIDRGMKVCRI